MLEQSNDNYFCHYQLSNHVAFVIESDNSALFYRNMSRIT